MYRADRLFEVRTAPARCPEGPEGEGAQAGCGRAFPSGVGDSDPGAVGTWGTAFFGWLVATGMAVILVAILSAAGAAIGLTSTNSNDLTRNAGTIGIGGGVALLIVLLVAYYSGGYVAGRMSRFDGGRQGLGVWALGVMITLLFAAAGAILGGSGRNGPWLDGHISTISKKIMLIGAQ